MCGGEGNMTTEKMVEKTAAAEHGSGVVGEAAGRSNCCRQAESVTAAAMGHSRQKRSYSGERVHVY